MKSITTMRSRTTNGIIMNTSIIDIHPNRFRRGPRARPHHQVIGPWAKVDNTESAQSGRRLVDALAGASR
jgi:hypothetical protein